MERSTRLPETARFSESGSSISWGAIFAGALIALAIQLLFTLFGSAIGLTAFDPERGESIGSAVTATYGIYFLITMIISFFIGGYCASRLAGFKFRMAAMMHGLASWAVLSIFLVYALGSAVTGMVGGLFKVAGTGLGAAAGQISADENAVSKLIPSQTKENEPRSDKEKRAAGVLAEQLGISQQEAEKIISDVEQQAGQVDVQQAAGEVTNVAAGTTWIAFLTLLLSGVAAILGALSGAGAKSTVRNDSANIPGGSSGRTAA